MHHGLQAAARAIRGPLTLLLAAALLTACGNDEATSRMTLGQGNGGLDAGLPAEIQLHLDSGNLQYRARDYEAALRHYAEVVSSDPLLAAGWYGVGMTHLAMGNTAAADSAMAQVHRLAPDLPLQHPVATAPPNPHPVSQP